MSNFETPLPGEVYIKVTSVCWRREYTVVFLIYTIPGRKVSTVTSSTHIICVHNNQNIGAATLLTRQGLSLCTLLFLTEYFRFKGKLNN